MGKSGMLEIEFIECKDKTMGYIACDVDGLTYVTTKKKASKPLYIQEKLYYPIGNPRSNVHFFLYKPRMVGDKCIGFYQFNLADLKESDGTQHFIQSIKKPKNILEPDIGEIRQTPEADDKKKKKKKSKKKEKKLAQFKVAIKFIPVPHEEKKLEGIVLDGEWKKGLDQGNIIGNPYWYKNPQYLLTVASKLHVTIALKQDVQTNRVTYFIIKYDETFYGDSPLTIYDPNEVFKIDENFLNTMASDKIEKTFELEQGSYIVIPCNLNKITEVNPDPYHGKFQIAASTEHMSGIEFKEVNMKKYWNCFKDKKKWTAETCGGSDRGNPFDFYKNYQYFVDVSEDTKASITLEQPTNSNKIGFYMFETEGTERKEIELGELAASTDVLISNVCVGKNFKLKKGKYILIPCASESDVTGEFTLRVYTEKKIEIKELTKSWSNNVSIEGKWEEGTAGGNVSDPASFCTNPQYLIKAKYNGEECSDIIILLTQFIGASGKVESIGLPVFVNLEARLDEDDINEDNAVNLPDAWVNNKNVFTCFEVDEEDGLEVTVVPSTMKPDTFANFRIIVLSDVKDISIEELTE
ncbi:Peptidase C2 calpain domain-containing protein [Entamoeba marina]